MVFLEREAYAYWRAAKHLRLTKRTGSPCPDTEDDLALILVHTGNAVIRRDIARLLDVPLDSVGTV